MPDPRSLPPASRLILLGLLAAGCSHDPTHHPVSSSTADHPSQADTRHTNRLASEKSPYLLQHQHNPVDWYPWGPEAFARARQENKPIFLSIGYSTCHWCHVMERESFENPDIARLLNQHFISIKVDREERPEVDRIYMTFVQATAGRGGWPLNVFLTPDLQPFFGGTYFPPDNRHGRPGFPQLLQQIHQLWQNRRDDLLRSARDMHQKLVAYTEREPATGLLLVPAVLHQAARLFKGEYDPQNGGFGSAPKFPRPCQPAFLLRYATRYRDRDALRMVLHTCEQMADGGIHDHLGGGFARYAVDARWLVPHFEKMLYDNAQLVHLYLDAFLLTGETRHADTAHDILGYILRDMTHPDGGFYSAEDADSEGKEGKFYCWTRAELAALLTPDECRVATRFFGITEAGNFVDHSDPHPLPNQNVLSVANPDIADADAPFLASARQKMFDARSRRVRPHLDDKILASWNGLMLGAFARAAVVLDQPRYLQAAERNLAFLQARLWDAGTRTLYHRWRDGERDAVQLLEAYAFLLAGVIDLYEATLTPSHLEFACALAESLLARFYDPQEGGFWQSLEAPDLILRIKEDYDGAEPSGNSVAVLAFLRLAAMTDRKEFRQAAEKTLQLFGSRLHDQPQVAPNLLLGLDFWLNEPKRVVIPGDPSRDAARKLIQAAHRAYQPGKVILGNRGPVESFATTLPEAAHPVAYLCTGSACQPPTSDPQTIKTFLE